MSDFTIDISDVVHVLPESGPPLDRSNEIRLSGATTVTMKPGAAKTILAAWQRIATETFPVHDPPVAWHVDDHPLAGIGIPVIACPASSEVSVLDSPRYMPAEIPILDQEPGGH